MSAYILIEILNCDFFCKLLILTKCAEVNLLSEKELDNFLGKDEHAIKCEVSLFLNLVLTDRIW